MTLNFRRQFRRLQAAQHPAVLHSAPNGQKRTFQRRSADETTATSPIRHPPATTKRHHDRARGYSIAAFSDDRVNDPSRTGVAAMLIRRSSYLCSVTMPCASSAALSDAPRPKQRHNRSHWMRRPSDSTTSRAIPRCHFATQHDTQPRDAEQPAGLLLMRTKPAGHVV